MTPAAQFSILFGILFAVPQWYSEALLGQRFVWLLYSDRTACIVVNILWSDQAATAQKRNWSEILGADFAPRMCHRCFLRKLGGLILPVALLEDRGRGKGRTPRTLPGS